MTPPSPATAALASASPTPTALRQDELRVAAIRRDADGVVRLTLAKDDGTRLPDWAPGAHIDVILPNGLTRQYSLCGDRWDATSYTIGVRREELGRGGSHYIHDTLTVGDVVKFGGPRNNFRLNPAEKYVFIAGGIGITPIIPMIDQAIRVGVDWSLLYVGRSRASMGFLSELAEHGDRVTVVSTAESARPDIEAFVAENSTAALYACGPDSLIEALERAVQKKTGCRLRTERFSAAAVDTPVRTVPFIVRLAKSGREVSVGPTVAVTSALRAAGIEILTSCNEGICGTCETTVISGRIDHRDSVLDPDERQRGTCMLPCVSRAIDDELVLDL